MSAVHLYLLVLAEARAGLLPAAHGPLGACHTWYLVVNSSIHVVLCCNWCFLNPPTLRWLPAGGLWSLCRGRETHKGLRNKLNLP